MEQDFYDITILGSGLVGASFALALHTALSRSANLNTKRQLKIAIIDKLPISSYPSAIEKVAKNEGASLDARALALAHTSVETLKNFKIWGSLEKNVTDIATVHISSKGKFGVTRLDASQHHLKALGAVIDADILTRKLNQTVELLPNLTLFRPESIQNCDPCETGWILTLASGTIFKTGLLVGADGSDSFLRNRCGVEVISEKYHQHAIVSNVTLTNPHHNIAYERFLPDGSIAFLPFGENRAKCILVVNENEISSFMALSDSEYLAVLQQNFGMRLGPLKAVGKRFMYPLQRMQAENIYGPGWVLLGNAANTLHPLAAQGFNLGLRDAVCLAEILAKTLEKSLDENNKNHAEGDYPGTRHSHEGGNNLFTQELQQYAKLRSQDHYYTHLLTHTLAKESSFLQFGILASEFLPMVKTLITQQGLGTINILKANDF